jgi:hypothetical protein
MAIRKRISYHTSKSKNLIVVFGDFYFDMSIYSYIFAQLSR